MGKDLPRNPKWTIVDGQIVYVCRSPCIEKIQADAEKFLTLRDKLYAGSQRSPQTARGMVPGVRN